MRLTVVGCSGSCPGPDSPASCYLVESRSGSHATRILLDLGSGALGPLQRYVDPLDLDAVFLSHLHPDHCADLCGYYVLRTYHPAGPAAPLPVWGPVDTGKQLARAYGVPENPGLEDRFDFGEYGAAVTVGPLRITVTEVVHPVPAFAIRVADDRGALVYTGDTGPCPQLARFAEGADLLLAEASFREGEDNPAGLHLTGREAGEAASAAGVGTLVLTHVPPWYHQRVAYDEARQVFRGRIGTARTGSTYDIGTGGQMGAAGAK